MSRGASAPGKLMIAGEYAVLEGATALVAAVSARVTASWSTTARDASTPANDRSRGHRGIPPEAALARELAEDRVGPIELDLDIDATDLRRGDRKLGLGSSSAAAVAAAGAVFAHAGHDVTAPAVRREVLDVAMRGHRTIAPQGSGADVAAAALGGVVRFRRDGDEVAAAVTPWPDGLHVRVIWTGVPARTSDLVARVRELEGRDRGVFDARMQALGEVAARLVDAFEAARPADVVDAAIAHHAAMAALGAAADAPIVEARLDAVARLARELGGGAKPSGAGGGDVALGFFVEATAADRFARACRAEGHAPLDLELGTEGVRPEDGA